MDKYQPGIKVTNPHVSPGHPYPHRDVIFDPGRLPGQLPLPYPKLHEPFPGPFQPPKPGPGR
jgi:hypothetical protein